MVELEFSGRTSNCLIQYCFGRIVAEHFGYALTFTGNNHAGEFPGVLPIGGKRIQNPVSEYNDTVTKQVHLRDILNDRTPRKILLRGFWQKSDFYLEHRQKMREWCRLPDSKYKSRIQPDDVVLHIRREDYLESKSDLNFSYYDRALEMCAPYGQVYIIGAGIDQVVRNYFANYNPVYSFETHIEDFKLLQCFKKVIMSNSSFAWMGAFLSEAAKEIFYPEPIVGYWSKDQDQKLFIRGEHTKIENVGTGN